MVFHHSGRQFSATELSLLPSAVLEKGGRTTGVFSCVPPPGLAYGLVG